jgi:branched-subunit amino acid aminotransferase/4-amino-4-deoxychorismate lyase
VLYGGRLPSDTADLVESAAAAVADRQARLRVSARPGPRGVELDVVTSSLQATGRPVALRTTTVAGGVGRHKWIDRRLIEALEQSVAPEQPLVCDADGRLLEGSRSNVFVVEADGRLVTPPDDGRLLAGVTRAAVVRLAGRLGVEVGFEELSVERLWRAVEVFATGSLGGIQPVGSCDGRPVGAAGPTALLLARALTQAGTDSARPAASRRASALVVCSQVKSSSSRPK